MGATNNFIAANFILGMANLSNPDFTIERWHTVLVAYAIAVLAAASNIGILHFLDKISKGVLIWNICSFVAVFITILAMNDHKQPASFVFGTFQNFTGFNPAYAAILGILQSAFGMCCYDAPAHMTEEIRDARKQAPRAMVMAVYIGAITGFLFLIALSFCIGDIDATATTPTGVPLIEIFYNSTGSVGATCALTSLVAAIATFCANSLMAEGSRSVYAFARDRGLPFSSTLSKVSRHQIPVNAVLLTLVVQMALNAIYFGTYTGFETVIAMSTEGFCEFSTYIYFTHCTADIGARSFLRYATARSYYRTY
jgi:amino acid transporter